MGGFVSWLVLLAQTKRQPTLLDLRVGVRGDFEVRVDDCKDGNSDLSLVFKKSCVEDSLQVRVELGVLIHVGRRGFATKLDVLKGKLDSLLGHISRKVEMDRCKLGLEEPGLPVDGAEDFVNLSAIKVIVDPLLPGLTQLNRGDALLRVSQDVGLEEVLEEVLTNKALHVVEKLEALFIGHV